jgi:hypothetical protein
MILMLAKIRMLARSNARLSAPIVSALALLAVLAMTPAAASARIDGFAAGGTSCGSGGGCHGGASSGVTVTITGSATMAPSSTGTYTATITGATQVGAGLDVASAAGSTSAGTLTATATGTGLNSGEVVHTQWNDGVYAYNFDVTAPAALGTFDLLAAMLGYDRNADRFNDNWNTITTPFQITVALPEPGTVLLLGMGLAGLAVVSRRRRA